MFISWLHRSCNLRKVTALREFCVSSVLLVKQIDCTEPKGPLLIELPEVNLDAKSHKMLAKMAETASQSLFLRWAHKFNVVNIMNSPVIPPILSESYVLGIVIGMGIK